MSGGQTDKIKQLEAEIAGLQNELQNFKEFLLHSSVAMFKYNYINKKFDYSSASLSDITGIATKELENNFDEKALFSKAHTGDIAIVLLQLNELKNSTKQKDSKIFLYRRLLTNNLYDYIKAQITIYKNSKLEPQYICFEAQQMVGNKDLEERLLAEKAFYQFVIDSNPNYIYIKDELGRFLMVNQSLTKLFDMEKERLINRLNSDFLSQPDEIKFYDRVEKEVVEKRKSITINEKFTSPNGQVYWLHTIKTPLEMPDGSCLILVNSTDITNLRKTELQLKASEARYKSLIDSLNSPYIFVDTELKLELVNRATEEWFNFKASDCKGKPIVDILSQYKLFKLSDLKSVIKDDSELEDEKQLIINNEKVWLWVKIQPVKDKQNELLGLQLLCFDVTERRSIEEQVRYSENLMRSIINATNDVIFLCNNNLDVITYNNAALNFYGTDKEYKTFYDIIDKRHYPEIFQCIYQTLELNKIHKNELTIKNHYFELGCYPVVKENGNPNQVVIIIKNITPIKLAEIEIRNALQRERELNQLKSSVISTVSHEFRTPLSVILSNLQIIQKYEDKLSEGEMEKKYNYIYNSMNYLNSMLDNISLLDKNYRGMLGFNPDEFHFEFALNQIIDEIKSVHPDNERVELKFFSIFGRIVADEVLIRHIIINVVGNALKYSEPKSKVRVHISKIKNNFLQIDVFDSGIGISSNDLQNIYKPFYRGNNVENIKGTGLGTSIIRTCVNLHNGTIKIESKEGHGTHVHVTLPFARKISRKGENVFEYTH